MSRFDYSDQLFENVPTDEPVVVAVSGGSDSMALLLLAHSWAQKHDVELHAVTIDHGLRAEAAAEAAYVAGICARMNLQHTVLAWDGMKPSFGIQEAARLNRYALMDDYAHEVGAGTILTGHTADDQAETVLMRAERRREDGESDGRGLAGMAGVTGLFGGTKVVRPLLHVSRNALRDFLSRHGQAWIEDPSNHDESFERVRLRQRLAAAPGERERLLALAAASAGLRRALSLSAAQFLARHATVRPGPVIALRPPRSRAGESRNPVLALALQTLVALAGGGRHFVARHRFEPLWQAMDDLAAGRLEREFSITLGGAQILCRPAGGKRGGAGGTELLLLRERRNLSSLLLDPGEAAVWDGRLQLFNGTDGPVFVEPADRRQISEFETERGGKFAVAPRRALLSTPLVHVQRRDGTAEPILPLVENGNLPRGLEARLASVAIEHFCPQWDFALRDWVRSLDNHASASLQP